MVMFLNGPTQKTRVELQLSYLSCTSVQITYVKFLERTIRYSCALCAFSNEENLNFNYVSQWH